MPAIGIGLGLPFGKRNDPAWLRDAKKYRAMVEGKGGSISDSDFADKLCPFVQGLYSLTSPDVDFYLTSSDYNVGTGSTLLSFKGTESTLTNGVLWDTDHVVMPHGSSIEHPPEVVIPPLPLTVVDLVKVKIESLTTEFQVFRGGFRCMLPFGGSGNNLGMYHDSAPSGPQFWNNSNTGLVSDAWMLNQVSIHEDGETYSIRRNASQLVSDGTNSANYADMVANMYHPVSVYNHMPGTPTRTAQLSFVAYIPSYIDQAAFYSLVKSTIGAGYSLP